MDTTEEGPTPANPRRAKHGPQRPGNLDLNLSPPARLDSPASRLHDMTRERIDALEAEKADLKREIARLAELTLAKARLEEALSNAEPNYVVATILIAFGGFGVSYATFWESAKFVANIAAGCLLSGIVLLFSPSVRRWRRRPPPELARTFNSD